ncbi:hypothetical protein STENM223S_08886 [Streptomyces tendae]
MSTTGGGIRADQATVAHDDGDAVLAAPTLTVGPCELVALHGPSGSGKATALRDGVGSRVARRPERPAAETDVPSRSGTV